MEYLKYQKLIMKLAHKYSKPGMFGIEFDDLYSLGNEIFVYAARDYQEEKGAFSTYLYNYISRSFYNKVINKTAAKKEQIFHFKKSITHTGRNERTNDSKNYKFLFFECADNTQSLSDGNNSIDAEKQYMFFEGLSNLSENSIKLINMILNMPDKMREGIKKINKSEIRDYLCQKAEWNHYIINNSFAEIADYMRDN